MVNTVKNILESKNLSLLNYYILKLLQGETAASLYLTLTLFAECPRTRVQVPALIFECTVLYCSSSSVLPPGSE